MNETGESPESPDLIEAATQEYTQNSLLPHSHTTLPPTTPFAPRIPSSVTHKKRRINQDSSQQIPSGHALSAMDELLPPPPSTQYLIPVPSQIQQTPTKKYPSLQASNQTLTNKSSKTKKIGSSESQEQQSIQEVQKPKKPKISSSTSCAPNVQSTISQPKLVQTAQIPTSKNLNQISAEVTPTKTALPQINNTPLPEPLIRPMIQMEWEEIDDAQLVQMLNGDYGKGSAQNNINYRFSDGMTYIEEDWEAVNLEFEAEIERNNPRYLSSLLSQFVHNRQL